MRNYLDVMQDLLIEGVYREGRNGGTFGLFGAQLRFDLSKGFPLMTTKRTHFKSIVTELLWFLRGDTNTAYLKKHGVSIWDEWADHDGELGPVYGKQWRSWQTPKQGGTLHIDQIRGVIQSLSENPHSRRHIVSAWNPADVDDMALPPCHCLFQFHVANGKLSCQLYQRSADWFLGVPFNIASYALLTHLIAREVGLQVGDFVHTFGDLHLYENHVPQAEEQLTRLPRQLPKLVLPLPYECPSIFNLEPDMISVEDYNPHPAIKAEVSA